MFPSHALIILGAAVLLFLPQYVILSPDDEAVSFTIASVKFQSQAILSGCYAFWDQSLGLGLPQPFSEYLYFHPALFLFLFLPAQVAVVVIYQGHLLLGAWACWRLCLDQGMERRDAVVGTLTYLLSAPSLNYVLTDFWPSCLVLWTMLPLDCLVLLRLLHASAPKPRLRLGLVTGLLVGLTFLNSHSGVAPAYLLGLTLLAISHGRKAWERWPYLALAGLVFFLLAGSRIYFQLSEWLLFDPNLTRWSQSYSLLNANGLWALFLKPLAWGRATTIWAYNLARGTRLVWWGPVFVGLATMALFRLKSDPRLRPWALIMLVGLTLIHLPKVWYLNVVAYLLSFRDPATLAGIILAGLTLTWLAALRGGRFRLLAVFLGLVQVGLMVAGAAPFWVSNLNLALADLGLRPRTEANARVLARVLAETEAVKIIKRAVQEHPGRVYYTSTVHPSLLSWRSNVLAFHGIEVVNGWFKGVSYQAFHPDWITMHGQILPQASVPRNKSLLDVLGVSLVLATGRDSVDPGLEILQTYRSPEGHELRLYLNRQAWPKAVVVNESVRTITLPRLKPCEHNRLLCADFSPLARLRQPEEVTVTKRPCGLLITLPPGQGNRLVMVGQHYRPGWRAMAGDRSLPVEPVAEALVGIEVPGAVTELQLVYRPGIRVFLEALSWAVVILSLAGLIWLLVPRSPARRAEKKEEP